MTINNLRARRALPKLHAHNLRDAVLLHGYAIHYWSGLLVVRGWNVVDYIRTILRKLS